MMCFFLLLLFSLVCSYNADSVNFIFSPSPNIEVGQSALYHCSVNDSGVNVIWSINGTTNIPSDIVVTGPGSSSSDLVIPGLPQYNNTLVRCVAAGEVDGNIYSEHSQSTLRVQG